MFNDITITIMNEYWTYIFEEIKVNYTDFVTITGVVVIFQ